MQALISVYDKTGLDQICPILIDAGYKIISTGGTFEYLKKIGIKVDSVYSITGESEILNGRVKTLHPKIHAGILADTENDSHLKDLNNLNIDTFDIVINNLYPFEEVVARKNSTDAQIIENIDIGGPAMLRAAAKNYKRVTVLIDPKDYEMLAEKITKGGIDLPTRKILAKKVFQLVSKYDKSIENYLSNQSEENFKNRLDISYHKISDLRYGQSLDKVLKVVDSRPGEIMFGLNMLVNKGRTVFIGDTSVHEYPTSAQMAEIAISAARVVRLFGFNPKVAFLSHSTFGQPITSRTKHIRDAVDILKQKKVDFKFDGDMQPDVALNEEYKELYPFSEIVGNANVLIMPGQHSAAISYKIMKTLGGAKVIGPLLIGLGEAIEIAPLRSSTSDILNLASVAAYSAGVIDYSKKN